MAIVKMSNFSLFAFDSERENLLHELQKFKYVHFLNLDKDAAIKQEGLRSVQVPESIVAVDEEISRVSYAIDILSKYHIRESGIKALKKGLEDFNFRELEEKANSIDYFPIYNKLRGLWAEKENLRQEIVHLETTKEELSPWIQLNSPIKSLNFEQSEVFLGTIPKKLRERLNVDLSGTTYTYSEIVSEDKDNLYVLALSSKCEKEIVKEILRNNNFSKANLIGEDSPQEEIFKINNRIKELHDEINAYENSIRDLTEHLPSLEIVYDYLLNKKLRVASSGKFLMTESVNVIKGYIPTDMEEDFTEAVKAALDNVYYLELVKAETDDPSVPILLKNSKFVQSFEALTGMYALPRYKEVDPTPFLAPFYLIFFGMMAADVAYGLIMLIGSFMALRKFNLVESTKKFVRFFYYLSFSVIIWGFLYGSVFGGIIPMKALFNPAEDYQSLLILSIVFGLIHIFFALGLKAYMYIRDGKVLDAVYDVGFWVLALVGAIVYLVSGVVALPAAAKSISSIVMTLGMVGIVATGGREAKGMAGKIGGGIYSLYGISGYVGDFVSYSRLMALGLAGGFIAGAVNMMAGMLAEKGIIGMILAVVIFIFGQLFNLGLSLLGAYVHTIRLTFVEFFGKFYEGGGKEFNSFRSKPKYINLK
ncbi:MAG: V-type ATP synthase subunit I [Alkaliphilus sp.]|nr:V-type ATP synthase subunit I [Alkaliphilus sp.]